MVNKTDKVSVPLRLMFLEGEGRLHRRMQRQDQGNFRQGKGSEEKEKDTCWIIIGDGRAVGSLNCHFR